MYKSLYYEEKKSGESNAVLTIALVIAGILLTLFGIGVGIDSCSKFCVNYTINDRAAETIRDYSNYCDKATLLEAAPEEEISGVSLTVYKFKVKNFVSHDRSVRCKEAIVTVGISSCGDSHDVYGRCLSCQ